MTTVFAHRLFRPPRTRPGARQERSRRMSYSLQYQVLNFALLSANFFSDNQTLLLSDVGTTSSPATLEDNDGKLYVGEQMTLDGRTVEMMGSGTAQPGVDLLGLIVPTGTAVDVLVMKDTETGEKLLVYPEGPPNLLSSIAVVLSVDQTGYDLNVTGTICFCPDTHILTPRGPVPVQDLGPGAKVLDYRGAVGTVATTLRSRHLSPAAGQQPVVIEPGAFGEGVPHRRIKVSPQHRICIPGTDPHGPEPLLGPAKGFTGLPQVRLRQADRPVTYIHVVTEQHMLLVAEGIPAESMLIGERSLRTLDKADRRKLSRALGVGEAALEQHPAAQPCGRALGVREARALVEAWRIRAGETGERAWPGHQQPPLRAAS